MVDEQIAVIDAETSRDLALDERLSPTAIRVYLLLRHGVSLADAARRLGRNPDWLRRYVAQLESCGYLEVHDVRVRGQRERRYVFLPSSERLVS